MTEKITPKLKVFQTVKDTYVTFFTNMKDWPKVVGAPFALYAIFNLLALLTFGDISIERSTVADMSMYRFFSLNLFFAALLILPVTFLTVSMIAIRVTRFLLLGEVPAGPWYQLNLDARIKKIILWTLFYIAILLTSGLVVVLVSTFSKPLAFITLPIFAIGFLLTAIRWGLYPVFIATDNLDNPLIASWRLTSWNYWRIFWTLFFILFLFIIINSFLLMKIFLLFTPHDLMQNNMLKGQPWMTIVNIIITVILYLIQYITLALIYKQLTGGVKKS